MSEKIIALISTLDTKIDSVTYMAEIVRNHGCRPLLIDVGALTGPKISSDFSNQDVISKTGKNLDKLIRAEKRDAIMSAMGEGASVILKELVSRGELDGVIGIGGNQGTAIAAMAMRVR